MSGTHKYTQYNYKSPASLQVTTLAQRLWLMLPRTWPCPLRYFRSPCLWCWKQGSGLTMQEGMCNLHILPLWGGEWGHLRFDGITFGPPGWFKAWLSDIFWIRLQGGSQLLIVWHALCVSSR